MDDLVFSRRKLLLGGVAAAAVSPFGLRAAGRGTRLDSPAVQVEDPLTGRAMERLTALALRMRLPHRSERFLDDRSNSLYVVGDADGVLHAYQYDLRRERLTQATDEPGLLADSVTLDSRGRTLLYLQHDRLSADGKTLQQMETGWRATGSLTVSEDGFLAAWIEMREGDERADPAEQFARHPRCRLRVAPIAGGAAKTLVEEDDWLSNARFRPGGREILYAHEGPWGEVAARMQLVSASGGAARSLHERIGEEQIGAEQWSSDGSRIWFVHFPSDNLRSATIRTVTADGGKEATVSPCSAFGWFYVNHDASAMVGASKRPSGPNVYVLFPTLQREITLCEHGWQGTDAPGAVAPGPILSRNSQWVYFSSEREGAPAVYRMKIEDLVSET